MKPTRKIERIFTRAETCQRKISHQTIESARRALAAARAQRSMTGTNALMIYKCPACGGWHLGNQPDRRRRRRSKR